MIRNPLFDSDFDPKSLNKVEQVIKGVKKASGKLVNKQLAEQTLF